MDTIKQLILLDCTLRDGGYYTNWDFSSSLVEQYLSAMKTSQINVVELGFRMLSNSGFKGAYAYTTDDFLHTLHIPDGLTVGVMVNGADLYTDLGCYGAMERLFPNPADNSPVRIVRFACHFHELDEALVAADWLAHRGYQTGINLMQAFDRTREEINEYASKASDHHVDVLYFADSMGSMTPDDTARIVAWLREFWGGQLGIHTHNNMGLALSNTLRAHVEGVTWLDATVTGMGRGPGNACTEDLVIEAAAMRNSRANLLALMRLIGGYFAPMKAKYGWGTNSYFYLAGKYGIHPTYVQQMLGDTRYQEEDILSVIEYLGTEGGKKFSLNTLDGARQFYYGEPLGSWRPAEVFAEREVLILGTGPGAAEHSVALESYIRRTTPLVLALNTQNAINPDLIDFRIASHPVRLLADADTHLSLPQPLIIPLAQLSQELQFKLGTKSILDFGIGIEPGRFDFSDTSCIVPTSLVLAYALSVATSGKASRILMAGFDGYEAGDTRNAETAAILEVYVRHTDCRQLLAVTPTRHKLCSASIYASLPKIRISH